MTPLVNRTAATQPSECEKSAFKKIVQTLGGALEKGGWVLYDAFVSAFNAFFTLVKTSIDAVVAAIEPILIIDDTVMNTFVYPQLKTLKALTSSIKQAISIPSQSLGVTSNACKTEKNNKNAVKSFSDYMTGSADWVSNKIDNFQYSASKRKAAIENMKNFVDYIDKFALPTASELDYDFANFTKYYSALYA